jgi:nucleotide-binding universal stress UspA family protein
MFKRILVPLDGSACAELALPVVARIARTSGCSIHLLEVVPSPIDYGGGLAVVPMIAEQLIEAETTVVTDYLQTMAASPKLVGIQTTTEVVFGIPAQYILAKASPGEVDLIVLCSHGRTGFTRWALGSVAHTLVHESQVPILILRESEPAPLLADPNATRPLRALVPLDGSKLAETALIPAARLVAALAAPAKGALHLAQVVKPLATRAKEGVVCELNQETFQRAQEYLASVKERLQATLDTVHSRGDPLWSPSKLNYSVELESDVAAALVNLAENRGEGKKTGSGGGCDLIATSTHGRHGLQRWVMGSVTERLLETIKLPILIVRPVREG